MSRTGRGAHAGRAARGRDAGAAPSAPGRDAPGAGLALSHPALWIGALAAAACVVISTGFGLWETDFWQHLLVGKAIWSLGHVPTTQLWSWPTYGAPEVNPSWGFSALIWPVWNAGGMTGLFLWRWGTSLAAFALLWLAARRMGARGVLPFVVLALAALTWRHRSQVRPETLVAVLIAAQIWILETRRTGGPDRSAWLVPLQWVWANVHLSAYLGLATIAFHLVHDLLARRGARAAAEATRPSLPRLAVIGVLALAVSFANPYGWRALWQPFEYFLYWRHEPIYGAIAELQGLFPFAWREKLTTGLPLLLVAWPALAALRALRRGFDAAEALTLALYTAMTLGAVRFAGFYALVAAPYVARDLGDALARIPRPRALRSPYAAAALAAALALAISLPEWSREPRPFGPGLDAKRMPVAACDFIAAHDVRGRAFTPFYFGGYLLWRFWPERDRLPFMDIHQSGTREEQALYVRMFTHPDGWREIDARYDFEWVLLDAAQEGPARDAARDRLDADASFALVFRDDAAAVYVARSGRHAELAARAGYRFVPGGDAALAAFGRAAAADPVYRAGARAELERRIASSRWNAEARSLMANLDFLDRDLAAARHQLEAALAVEPALFGAHERLALIAMQENRPHDAVRELEAELAIGLGSPLLAVRLADAYRAIGETAKARKWYGRAGLTSPPPGAGDTTGR